MGDAPADGEILIDPPPSEWGGLIASGDASAGRVSDAAGSFRVQLGLPDGPIVMSGHQPGFWHPGIIAKYAAVRAAAGAFGASSAWLVADLDDHQPLRVRVPVRDGRGVVSSEEVDLSDGGGRTGPAVGTRAPMRITDRPPEVLSAAADALRRARGSAATLAAQAHAAAAELLEAVGLAPPDRTISATAISGTTLFAAVLAAMAEDPGACVEAYNTAVARRPEAGVRPLGAQSGASRWELPIWRIGPDEPRAPVHAPRGQPLDPARHAPRGLLLTGLLRAAGCELFIHGTGGGAYDRITEDWLGGWLGMRLAPAVVVSATLRPELGVDPGPPGKAEQQIALAHRARHDPGLLGDAAAARSKQALVQRIAGLERGDPERERLYRLMHEQIAAVRAERADRLAEIQSDAERAAAALRSREAVSDRTWSFLVHESAAISRLAGRVSAAITRPDE